MKKKIVNILATTGLSLIILSVIALMFDAEFLWLSTIFEALLANVIVHVGLAGIHKLELKYFWVEVLLDNSFMIAASLICGSVFNWFTSAPVWTLILMTILIYFSSFFLNIFRVQQDAKEINELLQQKEKTNTH